MISVKASRPLDYTDIVLVTVPTAVLVCVVPGSSIVVVPVVTVIVDVLMIVVTSVDVGSVLYTVPRSVEMVVNEVTNIDSTIVVVVRPFAGHVHESVAVVWPCLFRIPCLAPATPPTSNHHLTSSHALMLMKR